MQLGKTPCLIHLGQVHEALAESNLLMRPLLLTQMDEALAVLPLLGVSRKAKSAVVLLLSRPQRSTLIGSVSLALLVFVNCTLTLDGAGDIRSVSSPLSWAPLLFRSANTIHPQLHRLVSLPTAVQLPASPLRKMVTLPPRLIASERAK